MKIAVYSIAKNEAKNVQQYLESTKEADGRFVLDTGSTDDTVALLKKAGVNVTKYAPNWGDWPVKASKDFARSKGLTPFRFDASRNFSLAQVPLEYDMCAWQDFDEMFLPGWREAVATRAEVGATCVMAWLTYLKPDGSPNFSYFQNRAHTRGNYKWRGIIHELVMTKNPDKERLVQSHKFQLQHLPDSGKSRDNYLPLLECQVIEEPDNPRYAYYFGRGLYYGGKFKEAIAEMRRYLELPIKEHSGYRSEAMRTISECYERLDNLVEAENWGLRACAEGPEFRENWMHMSWFYGRREDHAGAHHHSMRALQVKERPMWYSTSAENYLALPYAKAGQHLWRLGNPKGALKLYEEAFKLEPKNAVVEKDYKQCLEESKKSKTYDPIGFDTSGAHGWIPYFERLFSIEKVGRILELGLGTGTRFLLDRCQEVVSVEFTSPGFTWNWDRTCLEDYKKRPSWKYAEHQCSGAMMMADRQALAGNYPNDNSPYMGEIKGLINKLTAPGKFDMAFVDLGLFVRGDFVNSLFGEVDIIAAHDTNESAAHYGWNKINPPSDYERVDLKLGGMGCLFWIRKTKVELLQRLKKEVGVMPELPSYPEFQPRVQGWIPYFERLLALQPINRMLELGVGAGTRFLLERCKHVVSLELVYPPNPWPWDKNCINEYRKWPNWTYDEHRCGDEVIKASESAGGGKYPENNSGYVGELEAIAAKALSYGPLDMIFVDPCVYLRGEMVNVLFGKADIIAAHDTDDKVIHGFEKVVVPDDYERIDLELGGNGVLLWIKKTRVELINCLKSFIRLKNVTMVALDFRTEGDHVERAAKALEYSKRCIEFGAVKIISNRRPTNLPAGVQHVQVDVPNSLDAYNRFVFGQLADHVETSHCLLIQPDGFVINPSAWDNDFLSYDFVGAPNTRDAVLNGGFSLRSRKLLNLCKELKDEPYGVEDEAICVRFRSWLEAKGVQFAPADLALKFSVETYTKLAGVAPCQSFGFHGLYYPSTQKLPSLLGFPPLDTTKRDWIAICYYQAVAKRETALPLIRRFVSECKHVTELGAHVVSATWALMMDRPKKVVSRYVQPNDELKDARKIAADAGIEFDCQIEPDVMKFPEGDTDLAYLNIHQVGEAMDAALNWFSTRAQKYIVVANVKTDHPVITEFKKRSPDWTIVMADQGAFLTVFAKPPTIVWQNEWNHLGDVWFFANALMHMPPQKKPLYACNISSREHVRIGDTLATILPLLENKHGHNIQLVEPNFGQLNPFHKNWRHMAPIPTKLKWLGVETDRICYQFDGIFQASMKNPSADELQKILDSLKGYKLIKLGLPMTLEQIIKEMAASALFIGIPSGMSHVGVSVGIPELIYLTPAYKSEDAMYETVKTVKTVYSADELIKEVHARMGHVQLRAAEEPLAVSPKPTEKLVLAGAGATVEPDSKFSEAIRQVIRDIKPAKLIETGTNIGTGTTKVIAAAISKCGLAAKFYSIECNAANHVQARANLQADGLLPYVTLELGLSLPRDQMMSKEAIAAWLSETAWPQGTYVDYLPASRAANYFAESDLADVPDNLLCNCLKEFGYRPDFVLLDSAGHLGYREFKMLIQRLEGPCIIALDDIFHVKHSQSYDHITKDARFKVLAVVREKYGFCIARFEP